MWQHCQSCDSAIHHATALSIMWQHCRCNATPLSIMWSPQSPLSIVDVTALLTWCHSTVDTMQQHCWLCDSAVDHVTCTVDVMRQRCQSCDSAVIKVIQKTGSSLNWQWLCCNCVSWFPFVLAYKTGPFLHSKRLSGDLFQLTQWTNFPQAVGRCRPKNWSKSKTFDRLNRFFLFLYLIWGEPKCTIMLRNMVQVSSNQNIYEI